MVQWIHAYLRLPWPSGTLLGSAAPTVSWCQHEIMDKIWIWKKWKWRLETVPGGDRSWWWSILCIVESRKSRKGPRHLEFSWVADTNKKQETGGKNLITSDYVCAPTRLFAKHVSWSFTTSLPCEHKSKGLRSWCQLVPVTRESYRQDKLDVGLP